MSATRTPMLARLRARFVQGAEWECWLWSGTLNSCGYGVIDDEDGRQRRAHRIVYELARGPIPKGLVLDHLCRTRRCVNPAHLEPVTSSENVLRGLSPWVVNRRKQECKHGHPFTPENTEIKRGGKRNCKECRRIRQRKRHEL